jgi:aminopeptidase N
MESPGVIWIPRGTPTANLTYLVNHETAHQWFYGLVGNDQAAQPFADEAAADFLARHVLGSRRASRCASAPLDRTIYGYGRSCYYEVVYIQGGAFLDYVRRRMGNAAFWRAMRGYVAEERYGIARTQDLLGALDAATALDLRTLYARRFPRLY